MSSLRETFQLACPRCGQSEELEVQITTLARIRAEGSQPIGDHDWHEASFCSCPSCNFEGCISDFTVAEVQS